MEPVLLLRSPSENMMNGGIHNPTLDVLRAYRGGGRRRKSSWFSEAALEERFPTRPQRSGSVLPASVSQPGLADRDVDESPARDLFRKETSKLPNDKPQSSPSSETALSSPNTTAHSPDPEVECTASTASGQSLTYARPSAQRATVTILSIPRFSPVLKAWRLTWSHSRGP